MTEENKNKDIEQESTEVPVTKASKKGRKTSASKKKDKADDKIQELGEKLDEMNDKYLRLFSEFDNFRKRKNSRLLLGLFYFLFYPDYNFPFMQGFMVRYFSFNICCDPVQSLLLSHWSFLHCRNL